MPGAVISIVSGRDTLNLVSDRSGHAVVKKSVLPDAAVTVITSFIGYRTRKDSLGTDSRTDIHVSVGMQEMPMELNSVVVRGDAVAMVMHGDTTVFNAAAFRTKEGDGLRNILKQMPGVSVDDSSITYRGQRIDRILFNGTNLFGKDIGNAMDMVLADEVKSVKVYGRKAADDLEDDGRSAKERVLDVHTWKPLEHVGSLVFVASGGMFTSRNADGGFDWSADGMLQIGSYSLGARPRISAEVSGGHNSLGGQPAMLPRDEFNAMIRVGKDVAGKYGYTHSLNFRGTGGSTSGSSIQTFSPSDAWTERADTSVSRSRNRICSAAYSGDGYFRKGKTSIRLNGSLSYGRRKQRPFLRLFRA